MIICRQKKKNIGILLLCAFCVNVLLGCGGRAVEAQNDNTAEMVETAETSDFEVVAETVAFTEQELAQWTNYVNSRENNAFLLSYYDEPKQIDLNEHGDTNVQNFTCIAGSRTGNKVVLDCLSQMTGLVCRVTLELPENSEIWMFVFNKAVMDEPIETDTSESTIYGENFEDSIFISAEAYMEVYDRLGKENAQQLRVFAENFERWLPEEGATAGGTLGIAVYDLDKDGQLELMCTLVQGTGLYACNAFYHAEVENGEVFELDQKVSPIELAFEIERTPSSEGWANAYQDEQGRILYMSSDYGKAGMQSASCTEGYYYLENKEVVSVGIRSYVLEYSENGEEIYTYYLSDGDTSVEKEEWEKAVQTFQTGKKVLDVSVCWKDVYEAEINEKKVLDWFCCWQRVWTERSEQENSLVRERLYDGKYFDC